ncbi:MAG: DUF4430 domain-containing protein [Oscillospiraceae bacterium]|jgi:hypothetical protein|nr:DUF4430 domain-containing protein [Oscillospiraceae bacterium]
MEKQKKRRLYNALMGIAIAVVAFSGIMIVGSVKGWFQPNTTAAAASSAQTPVWSVSQKSGGADISRSGIDYALDTGTRIRDGDTIEALSGGSVTLTCGQNKIYCDQNSSLSFAKESKNVLLPKLASGEAFYEVSSDFHAQAGGKSLSATNATFSVSAPSGSLSLYVYGGSVQLEGKTYPEKTAVSIVQDKAYSSVLSIRSLNDFCTNSLEKANSEKRSTCFSNADLKAQTVSREKENAAALQKALQQSSSAGGEVSPGGKTAASASSGKSGQSGTSNGRQSAAQQKTGGTVSAGGQAGQTPSSSENTCTIEIRCDTILHNKGDLKSGKSGYVPADGTILSTVQVSFQKGETVFDVLKRVTAKAGIQLEYSWTPMYNSYYIEGIHHLYEFDCGSQSGWMYKVNGWFPNYGCSAYKLKSGDSIVWCYTCKGLGADVGGSVG